MVSDAPPDPALAAALARWPAVPAVFGWLALDGRGQWLLGGETIGNAAIRAVIGRHYGHDDGGRWYFQNGPQRVYVALARAPWVWRLDAEGRLASHTEARPRAIECAHLDGAGLLYLVTDLGPGVFDDRDLPALARRLVDRDGAPLDDAAIEALGAPTSAAAAWLRVDGLLSAGPDEARGADRAPCVAVMRLQCDAATALGYVRTPLAP